MTYRSKSYTYSGGDAIFPIPFDYIKENDIHVFINDISTTDFIIENHQVKLTVIPSELPAKILIKSQTDITTAVTQWQNTSLLDDLNLTLSNNQLLYATQELYDEFDDFSTTITQDITQEITDLKNETDKQISDFEEEVNETIKEVSEAAEKINELETAVEEAKEAATIAGSKAADASIQASNAAAQAQLAQQAAEDAEMAVTEIESMGLADKDLSNITEAGKDVIRDTAGSGFSLFDVVEKDHILSFEESMGFGLLGTYVYKEPVAGSRYGYPDFYNECVAQKEAGTEETITVGDVSFTATKNPNGHIFYDIADKATVDEIFSQRGEAWFYGVDTENERVFLPRGTRSQYTVNTDETGDYVEAGLPNITGTMIADISEGVATGALKIDTIYSGAMWSGSTNVARMRNWSLDASLSNPIYGNSDTVQPYATKKLLYIVVGNVKVQSAASDVVDVTTTENDTVPLFTGQYFNFKPNNPSWLKAGEQQDSGGIYTSCYNKLVQALTDNIWGIKVIDSAAMEEGTDYSEYWIVYQDAMRFRTPLTACKEIMPGNEITSSLGFSSNPTNTVESYTVPYNGYITIIGYKTSTSNTLTVKLNGTIVSQTRALASGLSSESYFFARKGDIVTVSTDSTSTGWVIATQTITKATANGELYFKAANVVENLEILNVGQVMEELSNKVNVSNTSWAINACMPDYSAQSTFTLPASGQTFTVPYDCLLTVCLIDVGVGVFVLRLNDASGAIIAEAASATVQTEVQVSVYLKKGWVVYNDSTVSRYTSCYITPLIGAEGAN